MRLCALARSATSTATSRASAFGSPSARVAGVVARAGREDAAAGGWASGLRRAAGSSAGRGDGRREREERGGYDDEYDDDGSGGRSMRDAPRGRREGRGGSRRADFDGGRGGRERRPGGRSRDRRGEDDGFYGRQSRGRDDRGRRGGDARERAVDAETGPPPLRRGHRRFYATCHPGLEEVVARELASPMINASDITVGKSGVSFSGTQRVGYDANIWLRSAVRVLVELKRGYLDPGVSGTESVYEFVKHAVPWEEVIPGDGSDESLRFGVETRVWDCSQISSSHAAKIRVKDAICDALVDATGTRPPPPENYAAADVPMYVTLYRDEIILYRDMSGESLHRRGYRSAMHRASLSESAAAGMLSLAGWPQMLEQWQNGPSNASPPVLIDPMCGSGTFLIEGALMAANVAPGLIRSETIGYAFERWPDHNPRTFEESLENARRIGAETRALSSVPPVIIGNDIHPGAVTLAGKGAETARVDGMIEVFRNDCEMFHLSGSGAGARIEPDAPRLVVTNPPWGKRIGAGNGRRNEQEAYAEEGDEYEEETYDRDTTMGGADVTPEEALEQVWNSLGVFLKRECPDSSAYVLSGNPEVSRAIRMRASRKHPVGIGGVDCRLLRYDILPPKPAGYVPPIRKTRGDERY